MKHKLLCLMLACAGTLAAAAAPATPALSFKTNIYDTYGDTNAFSIVVGTTEASTFDLDYGFGPEHILIEPAVFDGTTSGVAGTVINISVGPEGIVTLYGDASLIDYLDLTGCYIDHIDLDALVNLDVLTLAHNEIKSLDLSALTRLRSLDCSDNPFSSSPLIVGPKPELAILDISIVGALDQAFDIADYPMLRSFDAWNCRTLSRLDPTACPALAKISIDGTDVAELDLSNNPQLQILNIGDTRITSIDLSHCPELRELYADNVSSSINTGYRLSELDVTHNPKLYRLYCSGNSFTSIDLSKCRNLESFGCNYGQLTSLNIDNNPGLSSVGVRYNHLDFATLPLPRPTFLEYDYRQLPFEVNRSYPEGAVLDFSHRVLREGTATVAVVYATSETEPSEVFEVDPSCYTYEDGRITFHKAMADSVFVAFANSAFPDAVLTTDRFLVKTAENYGKPNLAAEISTSVYPPDTFSMGVGIGGATPDSPKEFYVDLGDGQLTPFTTTVADATGIVNVEAPRAGNANIAIYMPEGCDLTSLSISDMPLNHIDLSASHSLRSLTLHNTGLYTVDLQWNRCLYYLDLSGNNLTAIDLGGANYFYEKNVLADINLSHNSIASIELSNSLSMVNVDLSYNCLTALRLKDTDNVRRLDVSHNSLTELDLNYLMAATDIDCSANLLRSVVMPLEPVVERLDLSGNRLTPATLPWFGTDATLQYTYAPQAPVDIPTKGPGVDLSALYVERGGAYTSFAWLDAAGHPLVEGTDYSGEHGDVTFLRSDLGEIHCDITHAAFPDFAGDDVLTTTPIEAVGMPGNLLAEFVTVDDGANVTLSLAAARPNTSVYFTWTGTSEMTQYTLDTQYTLFSARTTAGARVKVYSYEDVDNITVFSITGARMSEFDGSGLTQVTSLTLSGAGLSEIVMPQTSGLVELDLDGNNFTSFDPSQWDLRILSMTGNKLTSIDLSNNRNLQLAYLSNNKISEIKLNNPHMWSLALMNNDLETLDLTGARALESLHLNGNRLSHLNLSGMYMLRVLNLDNNRFDISTLPLPSDNYIIYTYSNQAPVAASSVDGVVDLSSQASAGGVPTEFMWFEGSPEIDMEGNITGNALEPDADYVIADGITTFLSPYSDVVCAMTNATFPRLVLLTDHIEVGASGVGSASAPAIAITPTGASVVLSSAPSLSRVALYDATGRLVSAAVTDSEGRATLHGAGPGVYILVTTSATYKICLK